MNKPEGVSQVAQNSNDSPTGELSQKIEPSKQKIFSISKSPNNNDKYNTYNYFFK